MNTVCQALIDRKVLEVHYMADAIAMASIAEEGILSFKALMRAGIGSPSLANSAVQERRGRKKIVGIELHEFVPLYFATHTPMQHEIEHRDGFDPDGLFFADLSVQLIGEQTRLLYFTDQNAACTNAKFFDDPEDLSKIDWNIVQNVKRCLSPDHKARKAAELLVYPKVPTTCITRLACRSDRARQQMLGLLKKKHSPLEIDRARYFR